VGAAKRSARWLSAEAVRHRGVVGSSSGEEDIKIGLDVVDGVPGDGHGQRAAFARRRREERAGWHGDEFGALWGSAFYRLVVLRRVRAIEIPTRIPQRTGIGTAWRSCEAVRVVTAALKHDHDLGIIEPDPASSTSSQPS
jgi:hypothetical protein